MSIYAPYNFAPLSAWIFRPDWAHQVSHDLPFSDGISGTLELTIEAHSPLLVGQQKKTKEYPGEVHFFQLPDKRYAIPGSSLKGMIRNVLEIASFGKMRLVDDQWLSVRDLTKGGEFYRQHLSQPIGQNTYRPLARAGWLKLVFTETDGKKSVHWEITPCQYARIEHNDLIKWGKKQEINSPEKIKYKQSAVEKYENWVDKDKKCKSLSLQFDIEGNKLWKHGPIHRPLFLEYNKAKSTLGVGNCNGTLVFTGQPAENTGQKGRKHMEFIFYNPGSSKEVDEKVIRAFQHIHADSEEWKYWYKKLLSNTKESKVPVFYLEKSGNVNSLGLAMMYRLPYTYSIGEAIKHTHPDHARDDFYDLPELLFGNVNDNTDQVDFCLKSRVSFSLAALENHPKIVKDLPTTILGGPNASYYPNYVQQKNAPQLSGHQPYMTCMDNTAEVQGWKRYPINPRWQVPKADPALSNKTKVRLYPLAKDSRFKCYLKIHNLRPAELGALVWALTWGDNPNLRHGLGMGKPLGLGQVSIQIKDDSWQNLHSGNPKGTVPTKKECQQAFVDMMEDAWQNAERTGPKKNIQVKWADSVQLKQLLAMANPETSPGQVEKLAYMPLPQFQRQKNDRYVLPPYVNYDGPKDNDLFRRFTENERWQLAAKQSQKEQAEAENKKKVAQMEKELEKLSSDLERKLHVDLFFAINQSLAIAKASEWAGEMAKREDKEAQTIAGMLKKFYIDVGKWKGGSKKQKARVRAIKDILGE